LVRTTAPRPTRGAVFFCAGFTLTELVIVMLIGSILTAFAAVRLLDTREVAARGFADELATTLRFAHKAAVAQRRPVIVLVDTTAGRTRACLDAPCSQPLAAPAGGALDISAPDGVTLAGSHASLSFDALGRPSVAGASFTVSGNGSSYALSVEAETGLVRESY
jgi:MSHA pilin protein MshC